MKTNNEIKIAIVVAIIMITAILIAIIFSKEEKVTNSIDLKVYKLYTIDEKEEKRVYRECHITTDDVIELYKEYHKISSLPDSRKVTNEKINGDYKIVSGSEFIAFDGKTTNRVYRSDSTAIYNFRTTLYDKVVELCTKSEQQETQRTQTQQNEKIETEVKK